MIAAVYRTDWSACRGIWMWMALRKPVSSVQADMMVAAPGSCCENTDKECMAGALGSE